MKPTLEIIQSEFTPAYLPLTPWKEFLRRFLFLPFRRKTVIIMKDTHIYINPASLKRVTRVLEDKKIPYVIHTIH